MEGCESPFFPCAHAVGEGLARGRVGVGIESGPIVARGLAGRRDDDDGGEAALLASLDEALGEVGTAVGKALGAFAPLHFVGIDPSTATSVVPDETIVDAYPLGFGAVGTLATTAIITSALKRVSTVPLMGYAGVMLPILEDAGLARSAVGVQQLLLYSSVCGCGLDCVPVAGDATAEQMARVFLDMAALAHRLRKPLSARFFPVAGAAVGDDVTFAHPFLLPSRVVSLEK